MNSGEWVQIGKAEFVNTNFLFNHLDRLYSIETDGSLYVINTANGAWSRKGDAGAWKNTVGGAVMNGKLYTIETDGALYETTCLMLAGFRSGNLNSVTRGLCSQSTDIYIRLKRTGVCTRLV